MDEAIQSSVYVASPDFAGWLTKRGFHWRKLWKKRWVALHGAEIVYMDQEPGPENISSLKITKAVINQNSEVLEDDVEGNSLGFSLHINDAQVPPWYLRGETLREKKAWIVRLNYIIAIIKWLESFEKIRVLGVGGTGIVYELLHKSNGKRYALKEIEIKNQKQREMAISEAGMLKDIMENIAHPNILHIEKVFQVGSKFYLVFPLCTGGELYEHIVQRGHFTEYDAARITYDLISGLYALHRNGILHLDIKPENLLFETSDENACIKITDFGISRIFSKHHFDESLAVVEQQQKPTTVTEFSYEQLKQKIIEYQKTKSINLQSIKGTIGYMSPELILMNYSSKAADIFAAGVVVYILLCGRPPFSGEHDAHVLHNTIEGRYSTSNARYRAISANGKDLIDKMLKLNPLERITCEEILQHPWILQVSQPHLEIGETISSPPNPSSSSSSSWSNPNNPEGGIPPVNIVNAVNSTAIGGSSTGGGVKEVKNTSNHSSHSLLKASSLPDQNNPAMNNDLGDTLKALSKHVSRMRSQKMATNLTRLMSFMRTGNSEKSFTLSEKFLKPKNSNEINNLQNFDGSSSRKSLSSSVLSKNTSPLDETTNDREEELMILLNKDLRDALSRVLLKLNSPASTPVAIPSVPTNDGTEASSFSSSDDNDLQVTDSKVLRLSIEQFLVILHHFHFTPTSSTIINSAQRSNVAAILFCRFLDRDNDGYITLDDILTAQAMILQRSETFLKMLFRMYTESLWYPGRQLNYMNLIKQLRNNAHQDGNVSPPDNSTPAGNDGGNSPTRRSSMATSTPRESIAGDRSRVISHNNYLEDVVEPPKFITAKHVSAIFEKLGYDANHGLTVFNILSATAYRIKAIELKSQMKLNNETAANGSNEQIGNFDESVMKITQDDIQLAITQQQRAQSVSLLNGKGGNDKDECQSTILNDLQELLLQDQAVLNIQNSFSFGNRLVKDEKEEGKAGVPPRILHLPSIPAGNEDEEEDEEELEEGRTTSVANQPSANSGQIPAMMDVNDFIRACRTDDILVQAILRKPRKEMKDVLKRAHKSALESKAAGNGQHYSVAHFLEKEFQEAFQQAGTPFGLTSGNSTPAANSTSQKMKQTAAAVGKATFSSMFGLASKAMTWMSNVGTNASEEGESDEPLEDTNTTK